jgi:hypothetical protein
VSGNTKFSQCFDDGNVRLKYKLILLLGFCARNREVFKQQIEAYEDAKSFFTYNLNVDSLTWVRKAYEFADLSIV